MKRFFLLLLVAFILCGCGTSEKAYVPTGDGLSYSNSDDAPAVPSHKEEAVQELALIYYPEKSLNPFSATDYTNRTIFSLIYQGLFTVDRNYNAVPILCKSYSVSPDLCSYNFVIDDRATYSDGSQVTAADVANSLLTAWDSPYFSGRFTHFRSVVLEDNGSVTINLTTPYEELPLLLDIPIVKQEELESTRPLGSGPYYYDDQAATLRLRKVQKWWCHADLAATAPAIELQEAESNNQIRDQFQFFGLSLVCADPGSDSYADYRCDFELWDCENGIFLYLACNEDSEALKSKELRAALTYAIDREGIAEEYYRGFALPASLPASPRFPYYPENLAEKYSYDPLKFADAVSSSGVYNYEVVFLVNSDDSLRVRTARAIAQMLGECGMTVVMKEVPAEDYQQALKLKEYDLYIGQTKLSPNMDLTHFFSASGKLNYGALDDANAYTLCLSALENHGNYYTLYKTVMDEGLLCPILFRSYAIYATRGTITTLTPSRDNVFGYSIGKTLEEIETDWVTIPEGTDEDEQTQEDMTNP